jgi:LIVCS family branched-chain amino acid:cation transporter
MQHSEKSNTIATGLAMFSMFFGAGNVVFPLALGQYAQDKNFFAILGLLISAVGVPFIGLISMTLFNGNYKEFFGRIGSIPGFLVAAIIMGLIGPFGAIPRCITLSYSTIQLYLPQIPLTAFSIAACILIFLLTFRRNNIIEILGYVLTPLLLGSLAIIIIKGLIDSPSAPEAHFTSGEIFLKGLTEGYQTMDLLGAFFFSSVVLACLEKDVDISKDSNYRKVIRLALMASAIGAFLLSITYIGFSYTSAFNSEALRSFPKDALAGQIAILVLGPYASIVASIAVALACLTTAIALSSVFAEFLHTDITFGKINYEISLIITLALSFIVSTLSFSGIAQILLPILHVCYPALIVLSLLNIFYKLYNFKPVKIPVFAVFAISLVGYLYY